MAGVGYRADIDGLRAIAVGSVVIFHAGLGLPGGYAGVDVFFVISGFLITGILAGELAAGRFSLIVFYERRVRRIFPALFLMLFASVPLAWVFLLPDALKDFDLSLRGAVLFASNITFSWETGYFGGDAHLKPLLHTWSLAVEEQFYIVFPPLLWLLHRMGRMPEGLALLLLASFLAAVLMVPEDPDTAFYMPHFRAWELAAGALLAVLPAARPGPLRQAEGAAGLVLILWAMLRPDAGTIAFPGPAALPPVLGAVLLIRAGQGGSLASRLLSLRPLRGLGLVSYSLYLWHWPVLVWWHIGAGEAPEPGPALALLALSLLLAILSWRFVERPFRGPVALVSRRGAFRFAGGVMVGATALTLVGDWTDGLPQRYPADVRAILAAEEAWRRSPGRRCLGAIERALAAGGEAPDLAVPVCHAGPEGRPRLVVWGDSHAAALQAGIADWAAEAGIPVAFLLHSACPAAPGFDGGAEAKARSCARFNRLVLDRLLADPPQTVVMVARYAEYLDDPEGQRPPEWRAGLAEAIPRGIAALRAKGIRVILAATVPTYPFQVPDKLARARLSGRPEPPGWRLADHLAASARSLAVLEGSGADLLLRPDLALCAGGTCPLSSDGVPIYGDGSHLTPAGARLLLPMFRDGLGRP